MRVRCVTAAPPQIMIEQLAVSRLKFVFNNPGSLEALFFDALHTHPRVHGFPYILRNIVPRMQKRGISRDAIDMILVDNPARAFTFGVPRAE